MLTWKRCAVTVAAALFAAAVARADDAPLTLVVGSARAEAVPSAGTLSMTSPLSGTSTVMIMQSDYWLGLVATRPSPALQAQLNLPKEQGLLVEALQPESPAVKAGVQQYDILLKGNDKPLTDLGDLVLLINQVKDGNLKLDLLRAGKHETVTVRPAKRPAHVPEVMAGPLEFRIIGPGQILPPGGPLSGLSGGTLDTFGNVVAATGVPRQLTISPDVEKRLGELQKQLDELRQSVDALQGKAKEKPAAKPE
jgi:serine protease Do